MQLSRFDTLVGSTVLGLVLLTLLFIWRGDQVGLQVTGQVPGASQTGVSTRAYIEVIFDQPVTPVDTPLQITPPLSGTLSWQGNSLRFTPNTLLQFDARYTVTLADTLSSRRGRSMLASETWSFQTRHPYVLYMAADAEGRQQLGVYDPAAETSRQLTEADFGVWDYAPAPDGSRVVYAQMREDGGSDLWQLNLPDGEPALLLDCVAAACSGVAWTPDGRQLVYERRNLLEEGGLPGPPRLWWLNPGTGETLAVFEDSQLLGYGARWSADGEWLSFVVPIRQETHIYNLDDGRNLIVPSRLGEPASWSPNEPVLVVSDLQQIADGFAIHLLKVEPETEAVINLSGDDRSVEDDSAVWSPDGQWIAFTRKAPRAAMGKQLWLMRPDGSEFRYLTDNGDTHHGLPTWSPDGRYLAYQTFQLQEIGGKPSVWLLDLQTGDRTEIVDTGNRPSWLP